MRRINGLLFSMAVQDEQTRRLHLCIINHPLSPALTFITHTHSFKKPFSNFRAGNCPQSKRSQSNHQNGTLSQLSQLSQRHRPTLRQACPRRLQQRRLDPRARRPRVQTPKHEVAHKFLPFGLTLSADRVLNKEHKAEVHRVALSVPFVIDASMLQFLETDRDGKEVEITDPVRKQKLADSVLGSSRRL